MQAVAQVSDITAIILFGLAIAGAFGGCVTWVVFYVNGKAKDQAAALQIAKTEITASFNAQTVALQTAKTELATSWKEQKDALAQTLRDHSTAFTEALKDLRRDIAGEAEKRMQDRDKREETIWTSIKAIEHGYVRRDDLDGHLSRIDRSVGEIKAEMQENTKAMRRLTEVVIAKNTPIQV